METSIDSHGGPKKGVFFGPSHPHAFKRPKCLRGVGVKDCTWAPPMHTSFLNPLAMNHAVSHPYVRH